ncbi:UNVERIFIED_CONTAM: hypothetical protein Slati_2362000 [Sesamum latifolium]|uniref:Uncharacterized protein n=1 Tax=Sesamum latifolium TaxID=2727402 RepID=A0AAW2WAL5_9LAMI
MLLLNRAQGGDEKGPTMSISKKGSFMEVVNEGFPPIHTDLQDAYISSISKFSESSYRGSVSVVVG